MLLNILSVITPVFLCALIGFIWVKRGLAFDTSLISSLVTNIGVPCLMFSTFMQIEMDMKTFGLMSGAVALAMLMFGVSGYIVLRIAGLDQRTYLPSQLLPNVGNMGLPLSLLAFGDDGLAMALTYVMVGSMLGLTAGTAIASGNLTVRGQLQNPLLYGVVVTLLAMVFNFNPPAWLLNTTDMLGDLVIPLMLIALGVSLGRFKVTSFKRSFVLSLSRLLLGFGCSLAVAWVLDLQGAARGVLILLSSMPVAVFAYMFAVKHERNPDEVAAMVVISTVLSFLTLPLLLWYLLINN